MYKAIKDIGGYRIGDEVPASKAELWLEMYKEPHVEKVIESAVPKGEDKQDPKGDSKKDSEEDPGKKEGSISDDILDDYLGRNQSVVKKNLSEDKLSKNQLKTLLKFEEKGKNRPLVLNAIKERLNK